MKTTDKRAGFGSAAVIQCTDSRIRLHIRLKTSQIHPEHQYVAWCRLVLKVLPGEAAEQDLLDTMESLVRQLAEETQPPVILRLLNTTRHGGT
jgi:hypothetical protein